MSDLNDPELQALFDSEPAVTRNEQFVAEVMAAANRRHLQLLSGRIAVVLALVCLELLFESPISQSLGILGTVMKMPVVPIQGEWASFLIEPINSVAGVLGMVLLGVHFLIRRYLR